MDQLGCQGKHEESQAPRLQRPPKVPQRLQRSYGLGKKQVLQGAIDTGISERRPTKGQSYL